MVKRKDEVDVLCVQYIVIAAFFVICVDVSMTFVLKWNISNTRKIPTIIRSFQLSFGCLDWRRNFFLLNWYSFIAQLMSWRLGFVFNIGPGCDLYVIPIFSHNVCGLWIPEGTARAFCSIRSEMKSGNFDSEMPPALSLLLYAQKKVEICEVKWVLIFSLLRLLWVQWNPTRFLVRTGKLALYLVLNTELEIRMFELWNVLLICEQG